MHMSSEFIAINIHSNSKFYSL